MNTTMSPIERRRFKIRALIWTTIFGISFMVAGYSYLVATATYRLTPSLICVGAVTVMAITVWRISKLPPPDTYLDA